MVLEKTCVDNATKSPSCLLAVYLIWCWWSWKYNNDNRATRTSFGRKAEYQAATTTGCILIMLYRVALLWSHITLAWFSTSVSCTKHCLRICKYDPRRSRMDFGFGDHYDVGWHLQQSWFMYQEWPLSRKQHQPMETWLSQVFGSWNSSIKTCHLNLNDPNNFRKLREQREWWLFSMWSSAPH